MERLIITLGGAAGVLGMMVVVFTLGARGFSWNSTDSSDIFSLFFCGLLLAVASVVSRVLIRRSRLLTGVILLLVSSVVAVWLIGLLSDEEGAAQPSIAFWMLVVAAWLLAWGSVEQFASLSPMSTVARLLLQIVVPLIFGVWLLVLWELTTRGLQIPQVLLPSPSSIGMRISQSVPILWADFQQTFLKAVLIGYAMGCRRKQRLL